MVAVTANRSGRQVGTVGVAADGQVVRQDNADDRFTVDIGGYPYDALDKILKAFERADELR